MLWFDRYFQEYIEMNVKIILMLKCKGFIIISIIIFAISSVQVPTSGYFQRLIHKSKNNLNIMIRKINYIIL